MHRSRSAALGALRGAAAVAGARNRVSVAAAAAAAAAAPASTTTTSVRASHVAAAAAAAARCSAAAAAAVTATASSSSAASAAAAVSAALAASRRGLAAEVVKLPSLGDSISEGGIEQWHKEVGDFVHMDEVVVTIETDKTAVEIRAADDGVITERFGEVEDSIMVGDPLYSLDKDAAPPAGAEKAADAAPAAPEPEKAAAAPAEPEKAAPPPEKAAAPAPPPPAPAAPAAASSSSSSSSSAVVAGSADPREHRVKMTRMRKRIAERLKASQNTMAMLTTFNEVDMGNLIDLRSQYKDAFMETHGVKLGFMSAFIKASANALRKYPHVNAYIDDDTQEIVYRDYVDISVAVATPNGLVVPVIRDADKMSFAEIEKTIADLGARGRDGKLAVEDMTGGTFTVSNGGVYGSLMGTPIINPPQSAILGMHATKRRPAVDPNDPNKVAIRPMMYLALTYDHRLLDGKDGVQYLIHIKEQVEDPRRLILEL